MASEAVELFAGGAATMQPDAGTAAFIALWSQMRLLRLLMELMYHTSAMKDAGCLQNMPVVSLSREEWHWAANFAAHVVAALAPSPLAFLVATVTTLVRSYIILPSGVDNGGTYELICTFNFAIAAAVAVVTGSPGLTLACLPTVRALALVTYFYAWFSKLNSGFMNCLTHSCNSGYIIFNLSCLCPDAVWRPVSRSALTAFLQMMIYVTAVVEGLVPHALHSAYTWSLWFTCCFHLAVGTLAYDFSCTMQASLMLWVSLEHDAGGLSFMVSQEMQVATCVILVLALMTPHLGQLLPTFAPFRHCGTVVHGIYVVWTARWMVWAVWIGVPQAGLGVHPGAIDTGMDWCLVSCCGWLSIVWAVLNGGAPYLGLPKSYGTWSVFSNLRVEGGLSNHYIYNTSWQPFGFLRDVVMVEDSNCPGLHTPQTQHCISFAAGARANLKHLATVVEPELYYAGPDMPFFHFRAVVSKQCKQGATFFVKYRRLRDGLAGHRDFTRGGELGPLIHMDVKDGHLTWLHNAVALAQSLQSGAGAGAAVSMGEITKATCSQQNRSGIPTAR